MYGCEYQRGGRLPPARMLMMSDDDECCFGDCVACVYTHHLCCIFGFVVVDVNYNAGSVIPVSEENH